MPVVLRHSCVTLAFILLATCPANVRLVAQAESLLLFTDILLRYVCRLIHSRWPKSRLIRLPRQDTIPRCRQYASTAANGLALSWPHECRRNGVAHGPG